MSQPGRLGRRLQPTPRLTFDDWDALVQDWNDLLRDERLKRAQPCQTEGHDWAQAPIGWEVCRRCVSYRYPPDD